MKILLVGSYGQVGTELQQRLPPLGELTSVDRDSCDLTQPAQVRDLMRTVSPALIVNVAAFTAVDQAEAEPAFARAINADACALLAEEARRCGAALIHYSTDYVYDGCKSEPYVETDAVNPLSVYGCSKLDGERAIAACGVPHLVLRTSWVYAMHGNNFLRTMVRLARTQPELRVVDDQRGVPNSAVALASATAQLIAKAAARGDVAESIGRDGGIFHLSCGGATTWHGFATAIVEWMQARGEAKGVRVVPISTQEYPTAARRPANSVLSGEKLARVWGITLPHWRDAFAACVAAVGDIKSL